jgi:hypothetical protein
MARFRVPFSREEFGYIYFDAVDEDTADELVAQMEQGLIDYEDLPNCNVKVKNGSESVEGWLMEACS